MRKELSYLLVTAFTGILIFISCQKELSCENCKGNLPPVANAGPDKLLILPTDSVLVDGSASSDPDGLIKEWFWKKISGPSSASIVTATSVTTLIKNLTPGSYHFELKVTDNGGLFALDTMMVVVDEVPVNHPPVAKAGPDQTIISPVNTIILDGSGSTDLDNNITSYAWAKIAGPSLYNIANANNEKTNVTNLTLGVYFFELTVTDAGGLFSKDTMKLTQRLVPNLPPVANAGTDMTVSYNLQTCSTDPEIINLNGSASADPDGTIDIYRWSLISTENPPVNISGSNASIAAVTKLIPGNYTFRLQVTDNDGAMDDDIIVVKIVYANRPLINARLISIGTLSETRKVSAVASVDDKVFFAGGTFLPFAPGPAFSSTVDIYDINTDSWSTAELSQAKWGMTAATVGKKIFFAGGTAILSRPYVGPTSRIDVYDAAIDSWSTMEMPRKGSSFASIGLGDKFFVAGGNSVDIYDDFTKIWATKSLSEPRYLITATNVGGKLFFAGGVTDLASMTPSSRIDIYDPSSNSWSVAEMSKPKFGMAGAAIRGKIIWAGGTASGHLTNEVEVLNLLTPGTSFSCLFQPNSFYYHSTGKSNNKIVFFIWDGKAKDKFDIYDVTNDTWSIGILDRAITPSVIISVNNTIYIAGADGNSDGFYQEVWKLDF